MKKHVLHYFFIFIFLIMLSRIDVLAFTPRYDNPGVQGTYYLNDNPYPYKGQNGTWYAFGRAYEILGYRPNIRNGNANAWWNNNLNSGAYPYGQTPKLGAIACWNSGTYGHVAIVEDIVNNKIVISESNYDPAVTFRTREIDPYSIAGFQGYIYLTNEVPNIDVFASSPEIQDGEYIINCQLSPNMAIQTDRNNRDNGANVSIGNTNSSDYQIWKFQRNSDDTFRIISKFNNKALDVEGKKTQSEANIQTWDYVDGDNQKWYVIHTGGGWYQFIAKHSGKLMDVSGGYSNEGTNIWQYETNGSMAQFFKLTKVEPQNNQPQPPPSKPKPQPQPSVPLQPQSTLSKPQPTPSNPANSKIVNRYYKRGEYNEGMYEGEWKNESPNGFGRLTYDDFADGMFYSCQNSVGQEGKALYYEGHFINGWRNGVGVVVYEHGCKEIGRFFGNWAAGKKVFEGRFYDENGNYFEGYLQATSAASANWHAAKVNGIDFSNPFSKNLNKNVNTNANNSAYSKPTSSAPEIQDGDYVIRTQVYDNMAIQSEMKNDDNGSNVSIGIYKGYPNQKWHLQKNSDGTFRVICKSNNKALDVQDKGTQSRANIQTWDYVDGDNQKWYIVNAGDGWYQFIAKHSGHLMDVSGGVAENGTNIWQYEYNGSSAQKFKLESTSKIKRNYENWGTNAYSIRPVEYAYLSSFANEALNNDKPEHEKKKDFIRLLSRFPSNHPLRSIKEKNVEIIQSGTLKSMNAVTISYGKTAIVVFAGTNGSNIDDLITDFGILHSVPPLYDGSILNDDVRVLASTITANTIGYLCTDTQFEAANHLIDELEKSFDTILVTGHSLGGHLAVDVTLNHNSVDECVTFDAPGRGDKLSKVYFHENQATKIRNYNAIGSNVSEVGKHLGNVIRVPVKENYMLVFKNHDINEIINCLGGMLEVENAFENVKEDFFK